MKNFCGADCSECGCCKKCRGCKETQGKPFGGTCIAAEYIKPAGLDAYDVF